MKRALATVLTAVMLVIGFSGCAVRDAARAPISWVSKRERQRCAPPSRRLSEMNTG